MFDLGPSRARGRITGTWLPRPDTHGVAIARKLASRASEAKPSLDAGAHDGRGPASGSAARRAKTRPGLAKAAQLRAQHKRPAVAGGDARLDVLLANQTGEGVE